ASIRNFGAASSARISSRRCCGSSASSTPTTMEAADAQQPGAPAVARARSRRGLAAAAQVFEDAASLAAIALMCLLPLVGIVAREWLGGGLPGSISVVQHLTLAISFLGAALAARSDRLLALSTGAFLPSAWKPALDGLRALLGVAVTTLLLVASLDLVRVDFRYGGIVA